MWGYIVLHSHEILWAAVLGIFFAVVFAPIGALLLEMLPANSRIRITIRQVQNKLAERSAAKLRKRIASLDRYRENLVTDSFS